MKKNLKIPKMVIRSRNGNIDKLVKRYRYIGMMMMNTHLNELLITKIVSFVFKKGLIKACVSNLMHTTRFLNKLHSLKIGKPIFKIKFFLRFSLDIGDLRRFLQSSIIKFMHLIQ
jgi:hypothetical protein